MGYTLTIGELEVDVADEYVRLDAVGERHEAAPAFGEPTDNTNSRWPSYTAWRDFCRDAGIEPLFYGQGWDRDARRYRECPETFHRERPLLVEHPGAAPITKADADYVSSALVAFKAAHPDIEPGFMEDELAAPSADTAASTLARLIWLDYWMRWAVENCSRPVVANS